MTTFLGPGSDSGPSFRAGRVGVVAYVQTQAYANTVASAIVLAELDDEACVSIGAFVESGSSGQIFRTRIRYRRQLRTMSLAASAED